MKITRITIKDANGYQELQKAQLIAGKGISGDMRRLKTGRELSLLDSGTAERIRGLDGICTRRFLPGITFDGEADGMTPGVHCSIGTAVIRIMEKGKRCFAGCPLLQAGNPCGLAGNAVFAEVLADGWIHTGDSLHIQKNK